MKIFKKAIPIGIANFLEHRDTLINFSKVSGRDMELIRGALDSSGPIFYFQKSRISGCINSGGFLFRKKTPLIGQEFLPKGGSSL